MTSYPIYDIASAPEQSKPVLELLQQTFGLIPNIAGAMANSPELIKAFVGRFREVHSGTFSEAEIQTLLLLLAAPTYLDRAGRPQSPVDLSNHQIIAGPTSMGSERTFHKGDRQVSVKLERRISTTLNEAAIAAAGAGLGIVVSGERAFGLGACAIAETVEFATERLESKAV
jgi:LysR substrate binding domain